MEIKKPTLYIIPNFIGSNDSLENISKYNLRIIDEINYFIVESEKKSRRFIKKILPTKSQDDLIFFQIKKNKNDINNEKYLKPLIKGQNMGLMSDSGNPVIADPGASIINTAHVLKINEIYYIYGELEIHTELYGEQRFIGLSKTKNPTKMGELVKSLLKNQSLGR